MLLPRLTQRTIYPFVARPRYGVFAAATAAVAAVVATAVCTATANSLQKYLNSY